MIIIVKRLSARRRMRDAAGFTKQSPREEAGGLQSMGLQKIRHDVT